MSTTGRLLRFPGVAEVMLDAVALNTSPPHFHRTYMAAVFSRPVAVVWGEHEHLAGPERIALLNPREVHGGTARSRDCPQDAYYPDPELLLGRYGAAEPRRFPTPVVEDAVLARELGAAARAGDASRLGRALLDLFERHAEPVAPGRPAQEACPSTIPEALEAPVAQWARAAGWSPSHFSRRVRALIGLSPTDLRRQERVYAARALIEAGAELGAAAAQAGFADQAHMTRQFRAILGVTPGELRRGRANGG